MRFLIGLTVLFFATATIAQLSGGIKFFPEDILNFGSGAGDKSINFDYEPDGSTATITHDSANDEFDFNKKVNVTGDIESSGDVSTTSGNISATGTITTGGNIESTAGSLTASTSVNGNTLDIAASGDIGTDLVVGGQLNVTNTTSPSKPWPNLNQGQIDGLVGSTDGQTAFNTTSGKLNIYGNGAWKGVGGGGAGGSFIWELNGVASPIESILEGNSVLDFDHQSNMEIYAFVIVPSDYLPGSQIFLRNAKFTSVGSSGNVYFRTRTELIQLGDTVTTPTNFYISTNSENTLTVTNVLSETGDIDLSDASGEINSVAIQPGDVLSIRFYRDNISETLSSVEDARFYKFSASVDFGL